MNPALENVTSAITGNIAVILAVIVGMTALSLVAGRLIGKHDKRKRRAVTNLTFYGGMIALSILALPQIFGGRG